MESHVISVNPEASLLDAHRLFVEEEISGAPVIDEQGTLVGVISSTDLLRAVEEEHYTAISDTDYFRSTLSYSAPDWSGAPDDFQDRLAKRRVSEAMTANVITVPPTEAAPAVAKTLRENHIHRVFVVDKTELLGIISSSDILRLVEGWKEM
jgi:CBS domain-containing protein